MNKKYLLGGIVLLLVLGICLFFFLKPNSKEEEIVYQDVSITDSAVTSLYNMVNGCDDVSFLKELYQNETFSNEYILGSALILYFQNHSSLSEPVSSSLIAPYVYTIFGNRTYTDTSVIASPYSFSYNEENQTYSMEMIDYEENEAIKRKLISAKKTDTEYVLTEKSIVVLYEDSSLLIYDDILHTTLLDILEGALEDVSDDLIDNYLDESSTYEYHFTFNGENFVFTSFRKIS